MTLSVTPVVCPVIDFEWFVDGGGYRWETPAGIPVDPPAGRRFDRAAWAKNVLARTWGQARRYRPADYPGLFRTFADVPPTPAGVLAFAARWGHLGDEVLGWDEPPDEPGEGLLPPGGRTAWADDLDRGSRLTDTFGTWERAVRGMRAAVTEWEAVRAGTAGPAAPTGVLDAINAALDRDGMRVRIARVERPVAGGRPVSAVAVDLVPTCLLGAMWVQFARAVAGGRVLHKCRECPVWFEHGPDDRRADAAYCSTACRSRAYRRRKAEARRLAAGGVPLAEVARRVGSTPAKVRGWLRGGAG